VPPTASGATDVHYEERRGAGALCGDADATVLDAERSRVTCPRCLGRMSAPTKGLEGTRFWGPLEPDEVARWEVVSRRSGDVWNCVVVEPLEEAGTRRVFTERQILAHVGWEKYQQERRDEQGRYFAALPEGSIVHYHGGFGDWVRTRVVRVDGEIRLAPLALVGRWAPFADLKEYWKKKAPWRPEWTMVCESQQAGGRWKGDPTLDPRTLPVAVDLATGRTG
jgi:hypothetical protein